MIGGWKNKFTILQKQSHLEPLELCKVSEFSTCSIPMLELFTDMSSFLMIVKVVQACAVLWNIGILLGDTCGYDPDMSLTPQAESSLESLGRATTGGIQQRDKLTRMFFARNVISFSVSFSFRNLVCFTRKDRKRRCIVFS